MTTVTYRQIETDAVYTVISEYGNVDVFVVMEVGEVGGDGGMEPYLVERQRLVAHEGGFVMPRDTVHWCWTEDEARAEARRLCMEARSLIPGAFCVLDRQSRYDVDDAVYISQDQACEDGR